MRLTPIILLLFTIALSAQVELKNFFDQADQFLKSYTDNGKVDYKRLKNDPGKLNELVGMMKEVNLSDDLNKNEIKAFWINAYNISVIKSIVNNYPIDSPLDVNGFFDSKKHKIAGKEVTLDEIEKGILLPIDNDARIHFAINCAAIGCPKLVSEAYRPETLDSQLEERTKVSINDDYYVKVDDETETLYLNEIFKWYQDDFNKSAGSIDNFINKYRKKQIPDNYYLDHIRYNWSLNSLEVDSKQNEKTESVSLQEYTPAVLLLEGQYEIKIFNNLYTQTAFYNDNSEKIDQNGRSTYNTILSSFLYGLNKKINIGFELWTKSVHNDTEDSSPFDVFGFENNSASRTAITGIGPKIKFDPFADGFLDGASIQTTLLFPLASELEGAMDKPFLDYDAYLWLNQFFYDKRISDYFSFFGEVDTWLRVDKEFESSGTSLQVPLKTFLSYYPTGKVTLYGTTEFSYQFGPADNDSFYNQTGLGAKYQLFSGFELEGLVTKFFFGKNAGAGYTLNLGIRIVK